MSTVDLPRLQKYIDHSGYKTTYIAQFMGISRPSLFNKMHGRTEFTVIEVYKLSQLLGLSDNDVINIFFNGNLTNNQIVNLL